MWGGSAGLFAGKPAPTGTAQVSGARDICGSGFTRERAGAATL